jgi:poly(A) polymerase
LNGLKHAGFDACLVGGCVRDLMLGYEPKDFDIVTNALPDQILPLFRSARRIGRRFELIHVRFGREIIEVATYRGLPEANTDDNKTESGRLLRDNVFGTQEQDALRRDITVNALYYNFHDFSVIDYVGGVADLEAGILRMIGNPETRFREDPVRMLRVLRFAAKLGFRIEDETATPIRRLGVLLDEVPAARRFEEVLKLFQGGSALTTFELLRRYGLFQYLFPMTEISLAEFDESYSTIFVPKALQNTDTRIIEGKPVTPAFLYAVMLWGPVRQRQDVLIERGGSPAEALRQAASEILSRQSAYTSVPRRFSGPMREIWNLQSRFARRRGKMAFRLAAHERFRAAYDFLLLRTEAGELESELAHWWTEFQEQSDAGRRSMVNRLSSEGSGKGRKRRRRRKK